MVRAIGQVLGQTSSLCRAWSAGGIQELQQGRKVHTAAL